MPNQTKKIDIRINNSRQIGIGINRSDIIGISVDRSPNSRPYAFMKRLDPYKYEAWYKELDYNYAFEHFRLKGDIVLGGCSAVRNGDYYGRKYDWTYDEHASFIVHTPRIEDRFASVGTCGVYESNELVEDFCKTGEYSNAYKILPFFMLDGINEHHVVANINVVPADKGHNTAYPTSYVEAVLPASMVVRFIVDHFRTAREAVEYFSRHVEIQRNKRLGAMDYEVHWMIADPVNTYIMEIAEDEYQIREVSDRPYMTNFFTYDVRFNSDGTVYTPETQDDIHNAIDTNGVTRHGSGLERYNLIVQNYDSCGTLPGMRNLLDMLDYSRAYPTAPNTANPAWYTEFVHDDVTCGTPASDYAATMTYAGEEYLNRKRGSKEHVTWQSVHTSIYDIANAKLRSIFQEDGTEYVFNLDDAESVDNPDYTGTYDVTPHAFSEQILSTNGKVMNDDVTVHKIPYWETENLKNGCTVYIANEV